jgi:hypothetical protein
MSVLMTVPMRLVVLVGLTVERRCRVSQMVHPMGT